jgi:hypothetical protein
MEENLGNYSILKEFIRAAAAIREKRSPLAQYIDINGKAFEGRLIVDKKQNFNQQTLRVDFIPSALDEPSQVKRNDKLYPVERFMVCYGSYDSNQPHVRAWVNMPRYNVIPTEKQLLADLKF